MTMILREKYSTQQRDHLQYYICIWMVLWKFNIYFSERQLISHKF